MTSKTPGCVWIKKLGQGSYGEVFLAKEHNSEHLVAVKIIPKSKLSRRGEDNLVSEISILQKLRHPHIVQLLNFTWDSTRVYLIMEYCAGGDLSQFIRTKRRLPEALVRRFLRQLGAALQYLRIKNVVHMDLKPQNILLTSTSNPVLKVTDFGFAKCTENTVHMNELRGTLLYMAPEIYFEGVYHPSCDLWSVGVILYECLFGAPPYASPDIESFKQKLKKNEPIEIPSTARLSANCTSLLRGLLKQNPSERISHEEFFDHPFVDLKHAPGPESLDNALNHLELAHRAESSGDLNMAYTEYTRGLAHLVSAVEYEPLVKTREELKELALQYFERAEKLKVLLKSLDGECPISRHPSRVPSEHTRQRTVCRESLIEPTIVPPVGSKALPRPVPPKTPSIESHGCCKEVVMTDHTKSTSSGLLQMFKGLFVSASCSDAPQSREASRAQISGSKISTSPLDISVESSEQSSPRPPPPVVSVSPRTSALIASSVAKCKSTSRLNGRSSSAIPTLPTSSCCVDNICQGNGDLGHSSPVKQPDGCDSDLVNKEFSVESVLLPGFSASEHIGSSTQVDNSSTVLQRNTKDESSLPFQVAHEQSPAHPPGSNASSDSSKKVQRLQSLSTAGRGCQRFTDLHTSDFDPVREFNYVQQMALLSDLERLFELRSLCADSDDRYLDVVRVMEEFYTLLRSNKLNQALDYIERHFSNCLQIAKGDTNEKRRRAVLQELKIVLDLVEWGTQQVPGISASAISEPAGLTADEIGTEVNPYTDLSSESCRIS